jgi:hypothetical protein
VPDDWPMADGEHLKTRLIVLDPRTWVPVLAFWGCVKQYRIRPFRPMRWVYLSTWWWSTEASRARRGESWWNIPNLWSFPCSRIRELENKGIM